MISNLKITAHLLDGRIASSDGIIMFDSIVYHAWFHKYAPEVLRGEYNTARSNQFFGLPFAQDSDYRWYMASKGLYVENDLHIEHYNRTPDFFAADKINSLNEKCQISDSVGIYRAYRNAVVIRTIENAKIYFFARGNKEKIVDLLSYIPATGKKPSMGWGIVDKWEVEEIEENYSVIHPDYGLMRPIPVDEADQYPNIDFSKYPVMRYGIKPPYWKPCNGRPCYVPIMRSK